MSISVYDADWDERITLSDADNILPVGDEPMTPPAEITTANADWDGGETLAMGITVEGAVTDSDYNYVDGQVYLFLNGEVSTTIGLTDEYYTITGLYPGAIEGENVLPRDGDDYVIAETETGGLAQSSIGGAYTWFQTIFDTLTIEIEDANGQPVLGEEVAMGIQSVLTDASGIAEVLTAGEVEVIALEGTVQETVDVEEKDNPELHFQYAGLEGVVETPEGNPVVGKTVRLLDEKGEAIDSTTTDDSGHYEFAEVPIDRRLFAEADPYFRPADSRGQGEWVMRTFPSTQMRRGEPGDYEMVEDDDLISVGIEIVDAETGEPIKDVDVDLGDFRTTTKSAGRARGFVDTTEEDTVKIAAGENRRYRQREETVELEDEPIEAEFPLDRYVKSGQK